MWQGVPCEFVVLWIALLLTPVAQLVGAKEVLPPSAYVNRTVYPPIIQYSRKPHLAIGLLSDVQYADVDEKKRRHFRLSKGKLQQAIEEMNANRTHLDLVINLGDLVDHDMDHYLPILKPILDSIKYPFYQVLGNHDFLGSPEKKFATIYKALGMPGRYYSMMAGPKEQRYRLIIADGNDLALYSTVTGTKERHDAEVIYNGLKKVKAKNAQIFNGAIGSNQLEWIQQQLQEACDSPEGQRAIIFIHHPMRPKNEPTNLWNDLTVVPILTKYKCLVAVINGHAHKYLYDYHHSTVDGADPKHKIHFVTFGGMVQSPFTSFGFADIYDDDLHIHGLIFGRAISEHYPLMPMEKLRGEKAVSAAGSGIEMVNTQLREHLSDDGIATKDALNSRTTKPSSTVASADVEFSTRPVVISAAPSATMLLGPTSAVARGWLTEPPAGFSVNQTEIWLVTFAVFAFVLVAVRRVLSRSGRRRAGS